MKIFNLLTNKKSILSIALGTVLFSSIAFAVPTQIFVTNDTDLDFSTSIAGLPGNGIGSHISKSLPYGIVTMGCHFGGVTHNCPIKFTNKATGELVGVIRINAETAALVEPPVFYGDFADQFHVEGWDQVPISNIKITTRN